MTAYQQDIFGGAHRADPLVDIFLKALKEFAPTPPFPKTEIYKILFARFLSGTPQVRQAVRAIIQSGDIDLGVNLIDAALRHHDIPAPDSCPRAMRRARKIAEENNWIEWNGEQNDLPSLNQLILETEDAQNNIDSSLEARFHINLIKSVPDANWLRPGHIDNFTVDFLSTKGGISIEIDSYEHHSDRLSFTRDRRKARIMQRLGYTHLQYSGAELSVNGGINRAIDEIKDVLKWRLNLSITPEMV